MKHSGMIAELGNRDFGFIESPTAGRLFFGAAGLIGISIRDVRIGDVVSFVVTVDRKGRRQARSVSLVQQTELGEAHV